MLITFYYKDLPELSLSSSSTLYNFLPGDTISNITLVQYLKFGEDVSFHALRILLATVIALTFITAKLYFDAVGGTDQPTNTHNFGNKGIIKFIHI